MSPLFLTWSEGHRKGAIGWPLCLLRTINIRCRLVTLKVNRVPHDCDQGNEQRDEIVDCWLHGYGEHRPGCCRERSTPFIRREPRFTACSSIPGSVPCSRF